jgi:hypothetical protein
MKKILIILCIIGIFSSCTTFSLLKLNITNNYKEIIIKNEKGEGVYSLYCKINGKVNGHLEIEFTDGENYSKKIISENGIIYFLYKGDYYADKFIIKIMPNNVIGNLNINYKFYTLKPLTIY